VQGVDTGLIALPSAVDRDGNLADVASQLTGTVNGAFWANDLSQRLGYTVTAGEPYYTSGCTSTAECVFPDAVIPQSAFTDPTKALKQYIPLPNLGTYYTTSAYKRTLRDDKGSVRLDANTHLGMLSGYYFLDDNALVSPYGGGNVPGFAATNNGRAQIINLGLTKSFGGNSVNELRLHYMRNMMATGNPLGGVGVSLASQGFTGIVPNDTRLPQGVMSVGFNDFSIGESVWPLFVWDNTYHVLDNFSKVRGTHTLKFGGDFSYDQVTFDFPAANNGTFGFYGGETGNDFADFLIGAPSGYSQGLVPTMYTRARTYALYGQDSWRVDRNLTLNYGLRWEVGTPWWEAHNQQRAVVYGLQSKVFPGAPTGLVVPGDPGIPSTLSPTRYNNLAPRLGLAYSPASAGRGLLGKLWGGPGETSIRAAFGVYFTSFAERSNSNQAGNAPDGYWWSSPVPPLFATPFIDHASGHDEGQRFPVSPPL